MTDMFDLLSELVAAYGPSGREEDIAKVISAQLGPYADEIMTDTLGNLIVHKKGTGAKLMVAAHMDTIGVVVTYFEEDGTLRIGKIGGLIPKEIRNAPVHFANGVCGAIKVHGKAKEDALTFDDLYLDIGAENKEQAQRMVRLGDVAVFSGNPVRAGNRVISPYLDNRISCAVLMKTLEGMENTAYDLYMVFTVQEELGLRGAKPAAYAINPDYALAIDVTGAYDFPGAAKAGSAVLGGGAAIKVMDSMVICHSEMVEKLSSLAKQEGINAQLDVLTRGGTDAGVIHQSRNGVVTGGISIPCRFSHMPTSIIDLTDAENCVRLLTTFIENE